MTDLRSVSTTVLATVVALGAAGATVLAVPTSSAGSPGHSTRSVTVHRGGPDRTVTFHRRHAGEVLVSAAVSARGVSWAQRKNESAVVSAYVDGRYATDIVIMSTTPTTRQFALGRLGAGRHTLRLHYATRRSPSRAGVARLRHLSFATVRPSSPAYAAVRYAPVLYGRDVPGLGGRFQNNRTDTPLVAWHQVLPASRPGHHLIEYSVMWSNEDGGTSPPMLMAQWGRTTDIEWVYRVEVNAHGHRVGGTGEFQAGNHQTEVFDGRYDGTHPLLQTCTSNNNMCDSKKIRDPMRFALSMRPVLGAHQPREHEMDLHPWTYQVMGREMVREHKIEQDPHPVRTSSLGNPRTYLYVAVTHTTVPAAGASGVGLAVDVRLKGRTATYSSNHGIAAWTINRDGPSATTVELPAGTKRSDIASISVRRVPIGSTDNGASLRVTRVRRAFFLDRHYLPRPSFVSWQGRVDLTAAAPTRQIWPAT